MSKYATTRLSIPGRIVDLLWYDDEFFREVSSIKKAKISNFPKYDHWADENGFHMEFALAGYSPDDLSIKTCGNEIEVSSDGLETFEETESLEISPEMTAEESKDAKLRLQQGVIVRGIARRKFQTKFLISSDFDLSRTHAQMDNGLLHILVPPKPEQTVNIVKVEKS